MIKKLSLNSKKNSKIAFIATEIPISPLWDFQEKHLLSMTVSGQVIGRLNAFFTRKSSLINRPGLSVDLTVHLNPKGPPTLTYNHPF